MRIGAFLVFLVLLSTAFGQEKQTSGRSTGRRLQTTSVSQLQLFETLRVVESSVINDAKDEEIPSMNSFRAVILERLKDKGIPVVADGAPIERRSAEGLTANVWSGLNVFQSKSGDWIFALQLRVGSEAIPIGARGPLPSQYWEVQTVGRVDSGSLKNFLRRALEDLLDILVEEWVKAHPAKASLRGGRSSGG